MVQTIIINQSNIEAIQPISVSTEAVSRKVRNPRRLLTIPRIYRKELRMARAAARAIDAHPTVSNIVLWLMGIAIMVEIFLFA